MWKIINGQGGLFLGLLIAGLACMGWGTTASWPVLTSFGGAIFGVGISALLSAIGNQSFETRMLETLARSISASITSDESKISQYRRTMYFYHATEVNGKLAWRYEKLEFGDHPSVSSLYATTKSSVNGLDLSYSTYVAVRGKRFIVFRQPNNSDELISVGVFPHIGEAFQQYDSGLIFKQTWDGKDAVMPCILSFKPLMDFDGTGFARDSDFEKLNVYWKEGFKRRNIFCNFIGILD